MMKNPRDTYLAASVSTASPAQRLVMLLDRLSLDLQRASSALEGGQPAAAHEPLMHAQDIVLELHASLDADAWEGGPGLASLYDYLLRQLVQANVRKDLTTTADCLRIAEDLRDTWRRAALSLVPVPA